MLQKLFLLLLVVSHASIARAAASWSISIPLPDGTRRVIQIPFQVPDSQEENTESPTICQNCFNYRTLDGGRRMLVEPCGGPSCVSIVNNTYSRDNTPAKKYDLSRCGMLNNSKSSISPKALQMKVSTNVNNTLRAAEYPWLVRIESRSNTFSRTVTLCGGTLIHPQWVITAAHCLFDSKTDKLYPANGVALYMGHYSRVSSSRNEYITKPSLYLIHPKFRIARSSPVPIHDLALLKLARPVPLSRSIGIACLPQKGDNLADGTLAFTAGWGHAEPSSTAVNEPRKAKLKIASNGCRDLMIQSDYHVCGRNDRGNNICMGDSGTGLLVRAGVKRNQNQTDWKWHIFGVASYGTEECSPLVNHENAFASISTDIDWIREVINKY